MQRLTVLRIPAMTFLISIIASRFNRDFFVCMLLTDTDIDKEFFFYFMFSVLF